MSRTFGGTLKDFEGEKAKARKLSDLKGYFSDRDAYAGALKKGNSVVYETFTKSYSPMKLTLTVVNPGRVGKEFYFTKGHVHKKRTPEFYILMEGSGVLLIQKGGPKVIRLKKGEIALIPEGYAHRLVNNGKKKLKVLTIYHEDSRPDYGIKFKRKFFG